jgi:uncharacterized protein YjbI with pentapeptide repeats
MKKTILFSILAFTFFNSNAKSLITLEHNGTGSFYTNLDSAIFYALNGDVIKLPGGNFNNAFHINKELHFYGVGFHPDSTTATLPTLLNGQVIIDSNGKGSTFSGLNFAYNIYNYPNYLPSIIINAKANGIQFQQCFFKSNIESYNADSHYFKDCILVSGSNIGYPFNKSIFRNCILQIYAGLDECEISNCIILGRFNSITNSNLKNNIIIDSILSQYSFGNKYLYNNIRLGGVNFTNAQIIDNSPLYATTANDIFVNYISNDYIYSDFQLKPTCVGKNASTDDLDVGIYGNASPYKDGLLPITPHIQKAEVGFQTNLDGTLKIKMQTASQNK